MTDRGLYLYRKAKEERPLPSRLLHLLSSRTFGTLFWNDRKCDIKIECTRCSGTVFSLLYIIIIIIITVFIHTQEHPSVSLHYKNI